MNDDHRLLREYAADHSEAAFATLVSRHINLVYSVALRHVHDAHLAEEIAQAVFIILAQKAHSLGENNVLSGWLCRVARYVSTKALRTQFRRQQREQEAYMQSTQNEPPSVLWKELAPLLDGAMEKLGQKDHDALVLRFFENKQFSEIGTALGSTEDAAKMRVGRALDKMRKYFSRHGVISTAQTISQAISANCIQSAPTVLAKSATVAAVAKGAVASTSTLTLVKGASQLMSWVKFKTAAAKVTAVAVILLTATLTVNKFRDISKHISPFTMVQFDGSDSNKVVVAYDGHQYQLTAVDGMPAQAILNFCREEYGQPPFGEAWAEKRFAEDLVVVLSDMNHPVSSDDTVSLTLLDLQNGQQTMVAHALMTHRNRQAIMQNRAFLNSELAKSLGNQSAPPRTEWNNEITKLSPFTSVRFDGEQVTVTFNGAEYQLAAINGLPVADILNFCKSSYGQVWQRRFAEDLVPVLNDMGHPINADCTANLSLIDPKSGGSEEIANAIMTEQNRMAVHKAFEESHPPDENTHGN